MDAVSMSQRAISEKHVGDRQARDQALDLNCHTTHRKDSSTLYRILELPSHRQVWMNELIFHVQV